MFRNSLPFLAILGLALLGPTPARAVIDAAEGSQYLYLTTGPEDLHGGGDTGSDLNGDSNNESDLSSVDIAFDAGAGGILSFFWDVLTGEVTGGVSDWFSIALDDSPILENSILNGDDTPLPGPGLDGFDGSFLLGPDGSIFEDGRVGWMSFGQAVGAGMHTLTVSVYDDEDDIVDTAVLLDGLALDGVVFQGFEGGSPGSPPMLPTLGQVFVEDGQSFFLLVPEPGAAPLALLAVVGLLGLSRARR